MFAGREAALREGEGDPSSRHRDRHSADGLLVEENRDTLAGGDAGMRHFMAQFGPALKLPWTKLEAPELTDSLLDAVADGSEVQLDGRSIADWERYRDDCLMAVQAAIKATKLKHGIAPDA